MEIPIYEWSSPHWRVIFGSDLDLIVFEIEGDSRMSFRVQLPGTALGPFSEDQMSLLEAMGYAGPLGVEDPRAWLEAWANENQGST